MAMQTLYLGSTPFDEDCAQVGAPDYHVRATYECRAFLMQMERVHPLPDGAEYVSILSPHDFGSYREVVVRYDPDTCSPEAAQAAWDAEQMVPPHWDAEAIEYLTAAGFAPDPSVVRIVLARI